MSTTETVKKVCLLLPPEGSKEIVEYARKHYLTSGAEVYLLTVVPSGRHRRGLTSPKKVPEEKQAPAERAHGTVEVKVAETAAEGKGKMKQAATGVPAAATKQVEDANTMHEKVMADIKTTTATAGVKLQGVVLTAEKPNIVTTISEYVKEHGVTLLVVEGKEQDTGILGRFGRLLSPGSRAGLANKCVDARESWSVVVVTSAENGEEHGPKSTTETVASAAKDTAEEGASAAKTEVEKATAAISEAAAEVKTAAESGVEKANS